MKRLCDQQIALQIKLQEKIKATVYLSFKL